MRIHGVFKYLSLICLYFFASLIYPLEITGAHRGGITSVICSGDTALTSGEDGFLVTWDINANAAIARFQLTTNKILSLIKHPNKNEICIIEEAGFNNYRISAWNYILKEKLFTIHSSKPVTYINYSAAGSFIMAAGIDGFIFSVLNSSTGEVINDPIITQGSIAFAITNRTERNLLIYQRDHEDFSGRSTFSGVILYYNTDTLSVRGSFQAPGSLSSPVILGSNTFLAGVNIDGLQIINAATGGVLDTNGSIGRNTLLCPAGDELYCFNQKGAAADIYRFSIDSGGKLNIRQQFSIQLNNTNAVSSVAYNGKLIMASSDGRLYYINQQNKITPFTFNNQMLITEIASGKKTIAFLTEDKRFSILPLDFKLIKNSFSLDFSEFKNYDRISSFSAAGEDYYIIWQTDNTRYPPLLISVSSYERLTINKETKNLGYLTGRIPLKTITFFNNRILVMDSGGNITLRGAENLITAASPVRADSAFSMAGAIDAAFMNNDYIIISRSSVNNSSSFLSINIKTNETVPYFFPVQTGLSVYKGNSGNIYAAGAAHGEIIKTVFFNLSAAKEQSILFEYYGETENFSVAESDNSLAVFCGSEGAMIISNEKTKFERTSGLPCKLLSGGNYFLTLDTEGNIAWHDAGGKLLCAFSLYKDKWTVKRDIEITGKM